MSTTAYIAPYDPKSPKAVPSKVPGVDLAQTWGYAFKTSSGETPSTEESKKAPKVGTTRIFYNTPPSHLTALSSLGDNFASQKPNAKREVVRKSVGSAVKAVKGLDGVKEVVVALDEDKDAHAAAVGAHVALYNFSLKTSPKSKFDPRVKGLKEGEGVKEELVIRSVEGSKEWEEGVVYAYAQNLARTLMEYPANMMTPTIFCERVKAEFAGVENVEIIVRDVEWAKEKGMNTFLSVTHGTSEPAKFLEIHYKASPDPAAQPLAFVGKGITFDTGGISLKPRVGMKLMRGDMGGAASVISAALAIAKLKLPLNFVVCTPLTENMPGPSATKPGDIVYAMNGKSVEVDNTDSEGRLVLSDAIYYTATEFKPHTLIDVATLTSAMGVALGEVYTGVFSSSDELWQALYEAGEYEYDRFWRMPLSEEYGPQIYSSNADLCNTGGSSAGSCTAALFLKAFAEGIEASGDSSESEAQAPMKWAHIDMGTMEATRPGAYWEKGMSGRSVRALIEYTRRLSLPASS